MPTQIANFLAQNFRAPRPADVERDRYTNALMRSNVAMAENDVARIPQRNAAEDFEIGTAQRKNAAGIAANIFSAIEENPAMAGQLVGSREFQDSMRFLGHDPSQFTVTPQDTPESLAQSARTWRTAVAGGGQPQRVQSTFVGKDGNQWIVTADGRTVNTGVPVSQFAQRPIETAAGIESFQPGSGTTGGPISPAAAAGAMDQAALQRKQAEALGAGRGQAQAQYEAGAPQRTERARQQITNIDNVLGALDKAEAAIDWNTTGFFGNALKNVAGTPAHDLQQQLLTVQANLGFDRIQQMRESSPTGGALGQVAVQELNALQASVAALAQSQTDQALRENLQKVRTHYQNWRNVIAQAQGGAPQQQSIDELLNKYAPIR